jgi:hypothetical protein
VLNNPLNLTDPSGFDPGHGQSGGSPGAGAGANGTGYYYTGISGGSSSPSSPPASSPGQGYWSYRGEMELEYGNALERWSSWDWYGRIEGSSTIAQATNAAQALGASTWAAGSSGSGSGPGASGAAGAGYSGGHPGPHGSRFGHWITHTNNPAISWLQNEQGLQIAQKVSLDTANLAATIALWGMAIPRLLAIAAGGFRAVAAAEGGGLIHMTGAGNQIAESGVLIGRNGIYATSEATAGQSAVGLSLRTGVGPASATAGFRIPTSAAGAFTKPIPIGPITAWQRAFGTQYTAAGSLDLAAGTFARTGVNWNQVGIYGYDATVTGTVVGGGAYALWGDP